MNSDTKREQEQTPRTPAAGELVSTVQVDGSADPDFLERKRKMAELRQHIADKLKKLDQI